MFWPKLRHITIQALLMLGHSLNIAQSCNMPGSSRVTKGFFVFFFFFFSLEGLAISIEVSILQKKGTITTGRKGDFLGIEPNQDTGHLAPIIFCAIDSPSAFWQVIYSTLILCAAAVSGDNNTSLHHRANVRISMVSVQVLHDVLVG